MLFFAAVFFAAWLRQPVLDARPRAGGLYQMLPLPSIIDVLVAVAVVVIVVVVVVVVVAAVVLLLLLLNL